MTVYYTIARRKDNSRAEKEENRRVVLPLLLQKHGIFSHQEIKKDKKGRLFLPHSPTFDINLSHTDFYTAYATGDTRVGIDIESPDRIRDPNALARRFFTDGELRHIQAAENLPLAVCEIWTKKEALAKFIGTGLSKNLHIDTTKEYKSTKFHTIIATLGSKMHILTICAHKDAEIVLVELPI